MPRRPRAFTLIELLVVIAIIAILIGILLPTMRKARFTARVATCGTQIRQLAMGMMTYAVDSKGYFPRMDQGLATMAMDMDAKFYDDMLQRGVPHKAFFCPEGDPALVNDYWDTYKGSGMVLLGYAVWIPRKKGTEAFWIPNPGSTHPFSGGAYDFSGPTRLEDDRSRDYPILTDNIRSQDGIPVTSSSRIGETITACNLSWYSSHQWTPSYNVTLTAGSPGVVVLNKAFADGHVTQVKGEDAQPRHNRSDPGRWNWY